MGGCNFIPTLVNFILHSLRGWDDAPHVLWVQDLRCRDVDEFGRWAADAGMG